MRYTVALFSAFAVFFAVNALFIWLAVSDRPQIETSYETEVR